MLQVITAYYILLEKKNYCRVSMLIILDHRKICMTPIVKLKTNIKLFPTSQHVHNLTNKVNQTHNLSCFSVIMLIQLIT